MSFWDVLKAIGGALLNQVEKKEASIQRYEDKFSDLDHEELVKKYRSSSGDAKVAAGILLKERSNKNH
jgi:hypothetical protein